MAYILSLMVFFFTVIYGVTISSSPYYFVLFWHAPSFLLILIPSVTASKMAISLKGVKTTRIVFGKETSYPVADVQKVFDSFRILGNTAVLFGFISFFIGMILLFANLSNLGSIGPNMAFAIISMLYATITKIITTSIEFKLRKAAGYKKNTLAMTNYDWGIFVYPILHLLSFFVLLFAMSCPCK